MPTRNVVVRKARCQGVGGLLAIGSEETGGVEAIFAYDLGIIGTGVNYALMVKATPTRGGVVRDIHIDTLTAAPLKTGFFNANLNFGGVTLGDFPPMIGDITFSHITVDGAPRVLDIRGLPNALVGPVNLEDAVFTNITQPTSLAVNARPINYTRVSVNGSSPP